MSVTLKIHDKYVPKTKSNDVRKAEETDLTTTVQKQKTINVLIFTSTIEREGGRIHLRSESKRVFNG